MRKLFALLALAATVIALSACGNYNPSANEKEAQQQAANDNQQNMTQPLPVFPYSQWKQNLIEIETVEAKGIQSTSFIMGSQNSPDPIHVCPSVGMPIPITASLSNPQQIDGKWMNAGDGGHFADGVVGQKDPNGVYVPQGSAGTFVVCIGADGAASVVYAEGLVTTVFAPAVWDYGTHSVRVTGPSSFRFSKSQATR